MPNDNPAPASAERREWRCNLERAREDHKQVLTRLKHLRSIMRRLQTEDGTAADEALTEIIFNLSLKKEQWYVRFPGES